MIAKTLKLDEVTLMRTILALLIVFMHCFTCYQGGWAQPKGFVDIPAYKNIARLSNAFTLEAFVLISGYLFSLQCAKGKWKSLGGGKNLLLNKLKRLIVPSMVFSALYFPLFCEYKGLLDFLYELLNGCGHMWFLPMLFWCFMECWLLEQIKISDGWKLVVVFCLYLFWPFELPFQISTSIKYLFYFYGGYLLYKNRETISAKVRPKQIAILWVVFFVAFLLLRPMKDTLTIGDQDFRLFRVLSTSARKICQLIYASIGALSLYVSAVYYVKKNELKRITVELATCSFGIYIFQQFILKGLYYKTDFASLVGPYALPWLGFLIAATLSFMLSYMTLKTRTGRFLLG